MTANILGLVISIITLIVSIYWLVCLFKINKKILPQKIAKTTNRSLLLFVICIIAVIMISVFIATYFILNAGSRIEVFYIELMFAIFQKSLYFAYALPFILLAKQWRQFSKSDDINLFIKLIIVYLLLAYIFNSFKYSLVTQQDMLLGSTLSLVIFVPLFIWILITTLKIKNTAIMTWVEKPARISSLFIEILLALTLILQILCFSLNYSVISSFSNGLMNIKIFSDFTYLISLLDITFYALFVVTLLRTNRSGVFMVLMTVLFIVIQPIIKNLTDSLLLTSSNINMLTMNNAGSMIRILIPTIFVLLCIYDFRLNLKFVIAAVITFLTIALFEYYNHLFLFAGIMQDYVYKVSYRLTMLLITVIFIISFWLTDKDYNNLTISK